MKRILFILLMLASFSVKAQFPTIDSLLKFTDRYIRNSAVEAFTNLRLNTVIHGLADFMGAGAPVDSVYTVNDSTLRIKAGSTIFEAVIRGVYDYRRKVDSMYIINDSTIGFTINNEHKSILIRGNGIDNSKVPLSRTITINGNAQDLSADRTWTITKADVGLGNVDNTSDLNKPVSTAQQAALDDTAADIRAAIVGTNLSNTPAPTTVQVSSSTGTPTTLPAATFTNAGVFTARDKQMLDSAYQATKAGFGGDTSIVVYAGILRPSWGAIGTTDTLRWAILGIGDNHDTLGPLRVTATPVNGAVYVKYPHVARVISAIAVTDETLSGKGVWMGCSSGTDSTMITLYVNTMGNSLSTATGNGTGWNNANYVWAAGITTISMTGTIGSYDGYVSNVEYIGSNNYYIKYVTTAISAGTVKIQLWDRITNTQVTTAPTASDILLNKRPMFPTPVSNYYIGSTGIPNAVYGITGPNGISAGNIWFFFIGKRSI